MYCASIVCVVVIVCVLFVCCLCVCVCVHAPVVVAVVVHSNILVGFDQNVIKSRKSRNEQRQI